MLCRSYIQHLCEEINDIIQEAGQASVTDLSRNFSLPINFLLEVLMCVHAHGYQYMYMLYMHLETSCLGSSMAEHPSAEQSYEFKSHLRQLILGGNLWCCWVGLCCLNC